MKAAILAVGSELLGTDRLDTNSLKLTAALEEYGVQLHQKAVIGDVVEGIASQVRMLLDSVDLVLVTGGLGPTSDDVTREAVAKVLGRPLVLDEAVLENLRRRFEQFGLRMPEANRKQAEVIDGADLIPNHRGTAPGMALSRNGTDLLLFPGVPAELEGMIESFLKPWLAARTEGGVLERAVLKIASMAESMVEDRIGPAYTEFGRESISVLAKPGEVQLHLSASGPPEEREMRLAEMKSLLRGLVGPAVFTDREEETLEAVVGALLLGAGATVTTAESCTGGLLAERLTRVAGSSGYFQGGVVSYSNELKSELVGVPEEDLVSHGAVSEEVARAMAVGVRARLGSTYGIGVTGIAGPSGGSPEKRVGTVHIAVAGPGADDFHHRKARFPGDRARVRWQASQLALELLRRELLSRGAGEPPR